MGPNLADGQACIYSPANQADMQSLYFIPTPISVNDLLELTGFGRLLGIKAKPSLSVAIPQFIHQNWYPLFVIDVLVTKGVSVSQYTGTIYFYASNITSYIYIFKLPYVLTAK